MNVVAREAHDAWYPGVAADLEELGADGFSGSHAIRVRGAGLDVVLKSFAAAARDRVTWAHEFMRHLRGSGCGEVPEVIATPQGQTSFMTSDGTCWEAVRFVAGHTTDAPSSAQAAAAGAALARLHVAAGSWRATPPRVGVAPAVTRRIEHARRLLESPWHGLSIAPAADRRLVATLAPRLADAISIARRADGASAVERVVATPRRATRMQAVLRDIWCGHVIFAVDAPARVAGVIDFHAAGVDTPATDVARLLGSWRTPSPEPGTESWPEAMAAYERVRPLACDERALVPWLAATGTVFALDNWFRWCLVEGRAFGRPGKVVDRVDTLLGRLEGSLRWLVSAPGQV